MKIAIVSPVFPPYKGGIGKAAQIEARELAERGHDVTVFVPHPRNVSSRSVSAEERFKLVQLMPFAKWGNAAFLPQLFWRVKNFDAVHLHYPFFGGAEVVACCFRRRMGRGKLVVTYHHDAVGKGWLGKFFRWHTKHCMPKILGAADKIVVSSLDYAENSNIKNIFSGRPEKFVEVPFGVDTKKFQPAPRNGELLAGYHLKPDDKIILFVGGLDRAHYFKGLEILIKSKTQISDAKLLIVGDGDSRPRYEEMVGNLKIKDQIIFAGEVSEDELDKYYNLSDVVILPSLDQSEAFGIVLIEAMACGRPVIASNLPGVRSVIDYGVNGFLVEPGNAKQLAGKISDLFFNADLRRQFGQNGRIKVLEKYGLKKMGERLEQALSDG